jgi:hypothetical protein
VRDALIAFMAATAQAQAEATKVAQRAGIAHAKQSGERKYLGRKPGFTRQQFGTVRDMLGQATGVAQIAKVTGVSRQTVYRIQDDPAACEAALVAWGYRLAVPNSVPVSASELGYDPENEFEEHVAKKTRPNHGGNQCSGYACRWPNAMKEGKGGNYGRSLCCGVFDTHHSSPFVGST